MSVNIFNKSENKLVQVAGNTNWGGASMVFNQDTGAYFLRKAAQYFEVPLNSTYVMFVFGIDANSPSDSWGGFFSCTYGGIDAMTNIDNIKQFGSSVVEAVNNLGTIQFSFNDGRPRISAIFLGLK